MRSKDASGLVLLAPTKRDHHHSGMAPLYSAGSSSGARSGQQQHPWHMFMLVFFGTVVVWGCTSMYYWSYLPRLGEGDAFPGTSWAAHSDSLTVHRTARALPKRPLGLHRSMHAIRLEHAVLSDTNIGACLGTEPTLQGLHKADCGPLYCLFSPTYRLNVDLWFNALEPLSTKQFPEPCPTPRGGQTAPLSTHPGPPRLAIIITAHNHPLLAAQALLEAFRVASEVDSAEFVVVDDGSTEDMSVLSNATQRLTDFFGARTVYMTNTVPKGFGAANEQGIRATKAEYVMLLNSDAFLMKGAVFALMRTIKEVPKAGIVGPLMFGQDHRVSEAGGLVFSDGSPANFKRNFWASHDTTFRRPTDYVSAACIVMPRSLFWKVGGFDRLYGEGYFEDTDLALAVQARGFHVIYQPLAVVYHQEGHTLGTDSSEHKQALMQINQEKFAKKWAHRLARHCPADASQDMAAQRFLNPRVLWVDDIVPEVDHDSGSIRTRHILQILISNGYYVAFQPTAPGRQATYTQQARFEGVDVLPVLPKERWQLSQGGRCRYDVIVVARRYVYEPIVHLLKRHCPRTPIIYDTVDLHFLREARLKLTSLLDAAKPTEQPPEALAEVEGTEEVPAGADGEEQAEEEQIPSPAPDEGDAYIRSQVPSRWDFSAVSTKGVIDWLEDESHNDADEIKASRDVELSLVESSDLTIVVSDVERAVIRHFRPRAQVRVISNIHKVEAFPTRCTGRRGVLFVGNLNHQPNRQAILQLLVNVLPRVKRVLPKEQADDFVVHIVGANVIQDDEFVWRILHTTPGVEFHGYLSDELLTMLYNSVKAVVAPLLSGAGVKGKVNQAMKLGVPVVATPIAVEAMFATDGESCMIANTLDEFAEKLAKVYTDCALWDRLVRGGFENVRQYFSVESAYDGVLGAFKAVDAGPLSKKHREDCNRDTYR